MHAILPAIQLHLRHPAGHKYICDHGTYILIRYPWQVQVFNYVVLYKISPVNAFGQASLLHDSKMDQVAA